MLEKETKLGHMKPSNHDICVELNYIFFRHIISLYCGIQNNANV